MGQVFLSYAREDRGSAEKLARVLEAAEHEVWWDRRLDSGEEFSAEIETALDKSDVVLVAWSKESVRSRWVRDEAAVGGDTGRLVPVSIDGSLPPMGFRQFHTLDLTGWKGGKRDGRTAELLHSVERRLRANGEGVGAVPREASAKRRFSLPKMNLRWALAAMLLVAALAGGLIFQNFRGAQNTPLKPTIALLPFTTPPGDAEMRTVASQARESLARTFSQSGLPLRLLNAAPQDARQADFLISGDLSRNGDKIAATIRLDEAEHGATVYSHRFEASRDELGDLPEQIGVQTAVKLTADDSLVAMDRRHRLDPALIADLLSMNFFADELQSYQNSKRIAAKAPNLQIAQLGVAFDTAFALGDLPRDERDHAVAEARQAADRAAALGPIPGDIYATWCILHSEALLAQCEDRLRAGRRADPDSAWLNTFLSHLLRGVGRVEEATELARMSYTHDVYVPQKIAWLLRVLEYTGDHDDAASLYQQGARWWPDNRDMLFRNRMFGLVDRGDFDAIPQLEREVGATKLMPGYRDSAALVAALHSNSIAAARHACPNNVGILMTFRCMLVLARLGDEDGAYAIADKLYPQRIGRTSAETERIWLDNPNGPPLEFITSPAAAPMRRDPRFLGIAQRTGLLGYWRGGRPPDFCQPPHPEPVCAELLKRS
jgi:TolB-like protein